MSASRSRFGVLSQRNYRLYALGNTISSLGMWAQRVSVGWLSWELSHSEIWVGLVSLGQFLPLILFTPLFGSLLDRLHAKRYAIITNCILTAIATGLYLQAGRGALTIGRLCGFSVLLGIANSAYQPVRLSLVNQIVPPERLAAAIATNSMLYNVARSLGPALAGITIASLGIAATFAVNAISYAALIAALAVIEVRNTNRHDAGGVVADFIAGVRYVTGHHFIRELMLLSLVLAIFGRGVVELLPAFAGGLYQRGSSGLATLTTASGLGAILGGALLSRIGNTDWLPSVARRNAMWVGFIVVALGAVPNYWFAIGAFALLGTIGVISGVGLQVMLQKSSDESFRGRVLGLWGVIIVAGPSIGSAIIGIAAQQIGLRSATVASGLACALLSAIIIESSRRSAPSRPA
jgi:MFS family permease